MVVVAWVDVANTTVEVPAENVSLFAQFPSTNTVFPYGRSVPPVIVIVDEAFNWSLRSKVALPPESRNIRLKNGEPPEVMVGVAAVEVVNTTVLVPRVKVPPFDQFPSTKMVLPYGRSIPAVIVMVDEAFNWSLSTHSETFPPSLKVRLKNLDPPSMMVEVTFTVLVLNVTVLVPGANVPELAAKLPRIVSVDVLLEVEAFNVPVNPEFKKSEPIVLGAS